MGTSEDFAVGLDNCAREPVHIPGRIQPFGALVAFDSDTGEINYVSENVNELLGLSASELLNAKAADIFSPSVMHGIRNASSNEAFASKRFFVGATDYLEKPFDLHAFQSGTHVVVEIELADIKANSAAQSLVEVSSLLERMRKFDSEQDLLNSAVQLLQALSGYDRVMAYRFDKDFNGEIVAERKRVALEPFMGLRFPHWDIPPQARDIMAKVPIRFISDVDQTGFPLLTRDGITDPLDITPANLRGVSPIHMEYLQNMGVKGTLTLSLVIDGKLWGMFSFHHMKPRVPSNYLRLIFGHFIQFVEDRLKLIAKTHAIDVHREIEKLQMTLTDELDTDLGLEDVFGFLAPKLQTLFDAKGVALLSASKTDSVGIVPSKPVREYILAKGKSIEDDVIYWDDLTTFFPEDMQREDTPAGGLIIPLAGGRFFCFFRESVDKSVRWAGMPDKEVKEHDGTLRLSPRGSFDEYIATIKGTSNPWSDRDLVLARLVWTTVISAERRVMLNTLTRQQSVLIDELNHRVRNIISLIRSVSRQARKHYSSLDSYSASLEQRIHALAAAHDIGAGQAASAVSIRKILEIEEKPFAKGPLERFDIDGDDNFVKSEYGPLLALVMHEMTTNAAKYGSLSQPEGKVIIKMIPKNDGVLMTWQEQGGPSITKPEAVGFGTTLITQAVPYELGGTAKIDYAPNGIWAEFWLPESVLDAPPLTEAKAADTPVAYQPQENSPIAQDYGSALVVEDNLMMAMDMQEILLSLGFQGVDITGVVDEALMLINETKPSIAILDVNLGPSGETTLEIARELLEQKIPFIFVTGYGQRVKLDDALKGARILTKPVDTNELHHAISLSLSAE